MNKHLYCIVFNHALGLRQVVSELVRRPGRGASASEGMRTANVRPVSLGLWVAFGWIGFASVATAGQIVGDPNAPGNQRPTVLGAQGSAPLINIQTPSAAGVSRNTYSQFDVDQNGAVLNNSRTNTQTQLAGSIAGNPWLATGTAKIILNEVTGSNPSQLNGYVEVAGDRAQVIIANPAGIACSGCGFINANRVTLTTGTPVLSGGALDGYRVSGGTISVGGTGLDASRADYTDIIARSLQVNAGIWAPQLQVTTGANQVNAGQTQITPIAGKGAAPTFAVDVSALGGMYANKIQLLGTEHGVGVRNAGAIGAQAGDLVVTVDGRLQSTGGLQSQANTQINASGGVANAGTISAANTLTISTPQDLDNSHGTLSAARLDVAVDSLRNLGGTITQTGTQTMTLQAGALSNRDGGSIGVRDVTANTNTGGTPTSPSTDTPTSGGTRRADTSGTTGGGTSPDITPSAPLADGALHVAGLFDNDGGHITANAGFDLATNAGLANDGGQLELRQLTLTSGSLSNNGGTLSIDGAATIHANTVANNAGQLTFNGPLSLDAQQLSNRTGTIQQLDNGATSLSVTGTFDNTDGTLASNASSLAITSGTLINERGTINHAGLDGLRVSTNALYGAGGKIATAGAVMLTAGAADHRNATLSATQVTVNVASFDNRGGTINASGDAANTLTVTGTLENSGGTLASNGDLTIQANVLGNADGTVQQAGNGALTIRAATLNGAGGTIGSNGSLNVTSSSTDLSDGTTTAQQIAITTGALSTAHGSLTAVSGNPLLLSVRGAFDNTQGAVTTNGALQLSTSSLDNTGGTLTAAGSAPTQVQVTDTFTNTGGAFGSLGATSIQAGNLLNEGGIVQTGNGSPLTLGVTGLLDNSANGVVTTDGDLAIRAATLNNSSGHIAHAGQGSLTIDAATLNGRNGSIASNGTLTLTGTTTDLGGGTTQAQSIAISTGSLSTAGGHLNALGGDPLQLTVRGAFDNTGGSVIGNGALILRAASLTNTSGALFAAGAAPTDVQVAGAFDNTGGMLASAGATTLHAGSLINTNGTVQASSTAPLTLTVDGLLNNDQGALQSNGDLALTASSVSNHGGTVQTPGAIHASVAGTLDNSGGAFIAGGKLAVQADGLLNRDTPSTTATTGLYGQQVTLNASTLDNTHGAVVARDALTISGTTLSNAGGVLDGQGTVTVTGSTLDNTGGQLTQHGDAGSLIVNIAQGLSNASSGMIGAEGSAQLHAGAFDNRGGTTVAQHDLSLASDSDLLNGNGGVLQTHGALTLNANGSFDNSGGQLDATGAATIAAASVSNVGGQLLAGDTSKPDAALQITTGSLDNRGGTLGNRGGDIVLTAASIDNSAGGTLVAQRDLTLDTNTLNNAGGTTFATRNLGYQNASGTLDNTNGQFGAGDTATLNLAQLTNDGGHLQADTLWLTTPTLNNDGGEVDGTTVHATVATLDGIGRLYGAALLDAHITGDYTHLAGQRLDSDGVLSLTVDGTLTNQGTLQMPGELDITAANIINTSGAVINASAADGSGVANIAAAGTIDNQQGASLEGDTLALTAHTVTNTGNITGDAIRIDAATLINGRDLGTATAAVDYGEGLIGAAQTMDLHVDQRLANLDGDIYSGGDLTIAGRADSTRVAALDNISGRIQVEGHGSIAADTITNSRRFIDTEQYTLSPAEQYALSSERTYDNALTPAEQQRMAQLFQMNTNGGIDNAERTELLSYLYRTRWVHTDHVSDADLAILNAAFNQIALDDYGKSGGYLVPQASGNPAAEYKQTDTYLTGTRVTRESAASELLTGGDLSMDLGTHLTNYASTIAVGGNLTIPGQPADGSPDARIDNIAVVGQYTGQRDLDALVLTPVLTRYLFSPGNWVDDTADFSAHISTTTFTEAGPTLAAATITAGGTITIKAGDINNTAVAANGTASGITTGGLAGPGNTMFSGAGQAHAAGTAAAGGATGGPATGPGQQGGAAAQTIGNANSPLPGYTLPNNAMVVQHTDPSAPFLVTTAPRFAKGASTSSDYLLQALGDDPASMHKRLGDGYYEQNLVMDQILQLTGRRSLTGNADPMAQYTDLMTHAAQQAGQLGLTLGAPLTSAQIGALTSDIVWLVDMVVDGQHVLTPVVYLSKATADRLHHQGALIAGDQVTIQSSTTLTNDGSISSDHGTWLSADTLINTGAIKSGGQLGITTVHDTINHGTLSANGLAIQAGGDVINAPTMDGLASHGGTITAGTGGMQIVAARDVVNQGKITSAGDGVIVAGRDYVQNAATSAYGTKTPAGSLTTAGNAAVVAGRDAVFDQSTVSAGQVAYVNAGRDARFTAATISGGTGVGVVAGQDIISDTVTDHQASTTWRQQGRDRTSTVATQDTVRGSTFTSGGDVTLQAGRDVALTAANLKADGAAGVIAGRDINLAAGANTQSQTQDSVSKHGKTITHGEADSSTVVGTTISGAHGVVMVAGQDINATAATITSANGTVAMHADRDVNLLAGQSTHDESVDTTSKKSGLLKKSTTATHDESHDSIAVGTAISGSNVVIDAGRDINAQAAQVSAEHGLAVSAVRDVNLLDAHDVHTEEHDTTIKKSSAFGSNLDLGRPGRKSATTVTEQSMDDTVHGTTLSGGDGVVITAGRDVNAMAASVTSTNGAVGIHADRDVNLLSGTNTQDSSSDIRNKSSGHFYGSKTVTTHDSVSDSQAVGTTISGHSGVLIDAGRNVLTVGGSIQSDAGGIAVTAGDQIAMLAANSTHGTDHSDKTREAGFEQAPNMHQGTRKQEIQTEQVTGQGTTLNAHGPIMLASGGDQTYQAVNVHSDTGTALISGGAINFVTATNSDVYERNSSKHNVAYGAKDYRESVDTIEAQSNFSGPLVMSAADGITVGIGQKQGETQAEAIARAAGANPSSSWLYTLQANPDVAWQSVAEQHTDNHTHQEGVSSAAAVVITAVVTYFTAGLATGAVASATGATAGSTMAAATATASAGLGNAIVTGAIAGAAGGAAGAASQGYDWKQAALKGAIGGGVSGGLFNEAGTLGRAYNDGGWQQVGLHMGAGGLSNGLTGGSVKDGILSAGFAEGISPYMNDLPGGAWGQAAGSTATGAAGAWLGGGNAGQGALTGLAGYLYNRAMHPAETAAVDKLVSEGGDRTQLNAVACNEIQCWSGSSLGIMSGYTQDQVTATVQAMSPQEYQDTLTQLKQAAPAEFNYSLTDGLGDWWRDDNVGTRLVGTVQWLGGGLQAGGAAAASPAMCATGFGCAAAGYLWASGWDNANAGAYAIANGTSVPTLGGQAFQYLGMSANAAEFTYTLTQLSPAAYEAYTANQAVNTWIVANADARASYAVVSNAGFDSTNLESKLSGYLLDPVHPQNQTKANWFSQALGFDQSNWQGLAKQLYFDPATAVPIKITQYGQTFEQLIPITGANGKTISTTFVFMKDSSGVVRLVTGLPTRK
jgi:filamentous hemagglutinin